MLAILAESLKWINTSLFIDHVLCCNQLDGSILLAYDDWLLCNLLLTF